MAETLHARYCQRSPAAPTDNMYAYGDLLARCRDLCTDQTSFHLALVSLCRRKLATFTTAGDGEKVRLAVISNNNNLSVTFQPTFSRDWHFFYRLTTLTIRNSLSTSLFHSRLKTFLFNIYFPCSLLFFSSGLTPRTPGLSS